MIQNKWKKFKYNRIIIITIPKIKVLIIRIRNNINKIIIRETDIINPTIGKGILDIEN